MQDDKRCAKCRDIKPRSEFGPGKKWSDGLHPYCRPCKQASDRASHAKHKAKRNAAGRKRYADNPEPYKALSRRQYEADRAKWKAKALAWNRANPERRKAITQRWQRANLQGLVREATRRRYATRKGAKALYFTPEQLAARGAFYGFACWICRAPMTEWDHVKPLSRGGWHCRSNLRPICRKCNASKSDTWPLVGLHRTT